MHDYKKLKVWQEAVAVVTDIYATTNTIPVTERFNLISQINRSAVSIPSNIAEGSGRRTNGEFAQFLGNALGSCYELGTQLLIAKNPNFIHQEKLDYLENKINHIQKMIYNLLQKLKNENRNT